MRGGISEWQYIDCPLITISTMKKKEKKPNVELKFAQKLTKSSKQPPPPKFDTGATVDSNRSVTTSAGAKIAEDNSQEEEAAAAVHPRRPRLIVAVDTNEIIKLMGTILALGGAYENEGGS